MSTLPLLGSFYKMDTGCVCQIIAVAKKFESEETEVVFQEMSGAYEKYVISLEQFNGTNAQGRPLFEQIYVSGQMSSDESENEVRREINLNSFSEKDDTRYLQNDKKNEDEYRENVDERVERLLMEFLDATSCREKLDYLERMKPEMTERVVNNIAASMDLPVDDSNIEGQYQMIYENLKQKSKFECDRFR